MYLQVSEKVVYGLSCVALYIIYTIYIVSIYNLNNKINYVSRKQVYVLKIRISIHCYIVYYFIFVRNIF